LMTDSVACLFEMEPCLALSETMISAAVAPFLMRWV
jgi:hypothetical protein